MTSSRSKISLILSMVIFGTIGIFRKWIPLPSGFIAMTRGALGSLFLVGVMLLSKKKFDAAAVRKRLPLLAASGVMLGVNWILLFESYRYTTVAVATLCNYMAPVIVILASVLLFREKLTLCRGLCSAAAVLGMILVSGILTPGTAGGGAENYKGILMALGAAVQYAGVVISNRYLGGLAVYDKTVVQLGSAAAVLIPYSFLAEDFSAAEFSTLSVSMLLIVAILHTGVTYALYFGSISELPAQTVAIYSYIDPVLAILLSALLLHEKLSLAGIIGAVLVLGATALSELIPDAGTEQKNPGLKQGSGKNDI